MRFNTGNPVEPDGSSDPRDLYDNAGIADLLINGPLGEYLSRLGVPLKSWRGIMQQVTDYLIAQGYESIYLIYAAGVVVERQTQLVQREGELYRVMSAADIPLTLTGDWGVDAPKLQAVGDLALRQALADAQDPTKGAYMNGFRGRTVGARLDDSVNVKDDHGTVGGGAKGDGVADDTSAVMAAWTAATLQGKTLTFPAGVYAGTWGNLAANDLTMRALGRVELKNTGAGVALTLSAGSSNWINFRMEGPFVVSGNATSTNGVLIQGLHHSYFDLEVRDVPGIAVDLKFGVLSHYKLKVSNASPHPWVIQPTTGLRANIRNTGEYVADCSFDLIIEGVSGGGVDFVHVVGSKVRGTSEGNGGFGLREQMNCRRNTIEGVWCEMNGASDFLVFSDSTYTNCTAASVAVTNNVEVEGRNAKFFGGYLRCVNLQGTSADTDFIGVETSNNVSLGIKGTGTHTRKNCVKSDDVGVITGWYVDFIGGFSGSTSYDPPALADGAGASTTVTVTGAALGDFAVASFNPSVAGLTVTANVTSANTVTVRFQNESGAALDIGTGSLRAKVFR